MWSHVGRADSGRYYYNPLPTVHHMVVGSWKTVGNLRNGGTAKSVRGWVEGFGTALGVLAPLVAQFGPFGEGPPCDLMNQKFSLRSFVHALDEPIKGVCTDGE